MANTSFTGYIDDSGTSPSHRVATATALIIPAVRIPALEREWERLKTKEGFSSFHTSECVARNQRSEFANWDDAKLERVMSRVRQIGKKYGVKAYTFAIHKADFDDIVPAEFRYYIGNHYTWAIRSLIRALDRWALLTKMTMPFEYVYDWIDPKSQREARDEIDTVMAQAEEEASIAGKHGHYTNYSFRRRQDVSALQCTDALAWISFQYSLFAHFKVPLKKMAQDSWDDYAKHPAGEWLEAWTMTRAQLQDWVNREIKDGSSIARLREWEAKHPKKKTQRIGA